MMGRQPGLVPEGLVYHAPNRGGHNRQAVLSDVADPAAFREVPGQTKERYPFRL